MNSDFTNKFYDIFDLKVPEPITNKFHILTINLLVSNK